MGFDGIASFLADLGLSEYLDKFISEGAEAPEDLADLTEAELQDDFGITKKIHRKKLLAAIGALPGKSGKATPGEGETASPAPNWLATLPTPLAAPMAEYFEEGHPVAKLWSACDAVEMLVRLLVIGEVASASDDGELDEELRNRLAEVIEAPTLGAWFVMAQALAEAIDNRGESTPAPLTAAASFTFGSLRNLLYGPDKPGTAETSFLRLRNRLAHGGGLTRVEAERLLGLWRDRFESTVESAADFLEQWILLGRDESGSWRRIVGAGEAATWEGACPDPGEERDAVWLLPGERTAPLLLWPLTLYGRPCSLDGERERRGPNEAAQVYSRKESVRLTYTPVGAEGMAQSESGPTAMARFEAWFQTGRSKAEKGFEVADFLHDIRRDAANMVGRQEELDHLLGEIRSREQGVLWVAGAAGMGKSFLMAKATTELLDHDAGERKDGTRVLVLPYRMRAGDASRFRRGALAQFVVERLQAEDALKDFFKDKEKAKAEERLENALGALREHVQVILPLDGLDEVARRDESFAEELPLGLRLPRVLWVCAGRPEPAIVEAMRRLGGETVFPHGLPPMRSSDIRGMILEKIGPLRKRLLNGDEERGGEVVNPFIERVTERAAGLPLYVKYVIGDVLGGRYRVLDGAEDLPDSLHAYHEELLRRLGVGDLQAVVTPLAATLACAYEPLSLRELVAILEWRKLLAGEGGGELLERGLASIESMITTAPDPEGEVGYALFHQSLRTHILESDQMNHSVTTAREAMADLSEEQEVPEEIRNYFLRCGVRHLLDAERHEAAKERLLDQAVFETLYVGDEYELLGYWLELGEDMSAAYEGVFGNWLKAKHCFPIWLADFLRTAGYYGEFTEKLYRLALEDYERRYGPEDDFTHRCAAELAALLEIKGDQEGAEALFRRALKGFETALGPEHPVTLRFVKELGIHLEAKGQTDEAETLFRRALEGYEKEFGPEHEFTLNIVDNLALLENDKGDLEEAEALARRALEGKERALGSEDPATLRSVQSLGIVLETKGAVEEAETLYRRGVRSFERALGPMHPDTLKSIAWLANCLHRKGDYAEAEALFRQVLEEREKALGPKHPDTLSSLNDLATFLHRKGDCVGAEVLYRRAVDGYERAFPLEHESKLKIINNLGLLQSEKGNLEEAEVLLRRALEGREKLLGPEHLDTLASIHNLENLFRDNGDFERAVKLIRRWRNRSDLSEDWEGMESLGYNLACYECHFGNIDEARRLISEHLARYPHNKAMALADDSLAGIREWIAGL